jgi:hypothetical protein
MWGLKTLGRGVVTILISPLILAGIILILIYSFLVYLIYEVSSVYLFFLGKNFNSDDHETIKLKEVMTGIEPGYYKVDQSLVNQVQNQSTVVEKERQDGGNNDV